MPRERCLITARLAGPCASCRQPAWPAHVWPDGRILCGNCCPCARRDAAPRRAAAGPGHEAGPGHDALADRGRHQGQAHGMPPARSGPDAPARGRTIRPTLPPIPPARSGPAHAMPLARATGRAIAPAGPRKARDTAPPVASDSGAISGPARAIVRAGLPGAAPAGPGVGMLPPWPARRRGPGRPRKPGPGTSSRRTPRQNISASECSGGNFITDWRFA